MKELDFHKIRYGGQDRPPRLTGRSPLQTAGAASVIASDAVRAAGPKKGGHLRTGIAMGRPPI